MPTWLDMVKIEIENMDTSKLIEPPQEVDCNRDHVVCDAEEALRKLYSLAMQFEKEATVALINARYSGNVNDIKDAVENGTRLMKKVETLREIFWISLKDNYDLWDKSSVGIRKGWKVVWSDSDPVPPIIGLLGDLFGGGR